MYGAAGNRPERQWVAPGPMHSRHRPQGRSERGAPRFRTRQRKRDDRLSKWTLSMRPCASATRAQELAVLLGQLRGQEARVTEICGDGQLIQGSREKKADLIKV